jgi:hypothetical protein
MYDNTEGDKVSYTRVTKIERSQIYEPRQAGNYDQIMKPIMKPAIPAAPIHAAPHFVAFFVPRIVVYASSQDFVETALIQPYLNTKVLDTDSLIDRR